MHDLFDISGKTVIVTGGVSGLGRMIAQGLLAAGARVIVTSRKAAPEGAAALSSAGQCVGINLDPGKPGALTSFVEAVRGETAGVDVLINNAGKTWGEALERFPDEAFASVMAVNVQTPFALVRDLLPLLERNATPEDPSRVINIGSVAGLAVEGLSAYSYSASKAAIHHLSRELAADLAGRHINVNALVPGYFETKMTAHLRADEARNDAAVSRIPRQRFGGPADIVGAVIYLASRASAYVTGAQIVVDGGLSGAGKP